MYFGLAALFMGGWVSLTLFFSAISYKIVKFLCSLERKYPDYLRADKNVHSGTSPHSQGVNIMTLIIWWVAHLAYVNLGSAPVPWIWVWGLANNLNIFNQNVVLIVK